MESQKVGLFIKEMRLRFNMTQKELAEKLSVTDKAVSRWETGQGYPEVTLLPKLAAIFQISIEELLNGEQNPSPSETDRELQELPQKFTHKKYVKIMLTIPVVVGIAVLLLGILACFTSRIFHLPYMFMTIIGLFLIWLIISTLTCFLPLSAAYLWHKLNKKS